MMDLALLDAREYSKCWLKLGSGLKEAKIYGKDDEHVKRIKVDLYPIEKTQLIQPIKKYKKVFS